MRQQNDRQDYRLNDNELIFLELYINDEAVIAISDSVDISTNGLQMVLGYTLPMNSIQEICVRLENPVCQLHLVAEVVWQRDGPNPDEYLIGLSLLESDDTDIGRWKEIIAERYFS